MARQVEVEKCIVFGSELRLVVDGKGSQERGRGNARIYGNEMRSEMQEMWRKSFRLIGRAPFLHALVDKDAVGLLLKARSDEDR